MLRINQFNIGNDPVSSLDDKLKKLFDDLEHHDIPHESLKNLQNETGENIKGVQKGTHKKCSACNMIYPKQEFHDSELKSKYGRNCKNCKAKKNAANSSRNYRFSRHW